MEDVEKLLKDFTLFLWMRDINIKEELVQEYIEDLKKKNKKS